MISLSPPYLVQDGYTLLSDHADPGQLYVLPSAPGLALKEPGVPDFSLLQYLGGGLGAQKLAGGLLTLTLKLEVNDETLTKLTSRARQRLGREVRLSPVQFDAGTVELVALGSSSAAPSTATSSPFSLQFLGSGKPSLSGANVATFQLLLDANAAELVEKALETPELPLIAIYRLQFSGLRPSYGLSIQADWRKVYSSLQHKAKANLYYAATDVDALLESTLKEQNIKIDTDIFGTGEGERAAAERARKQLLDWTLEHFFSPLTDPTAATANTIGRVVEDTVSSLVRSLVPGVSYRLRVLNEEQLAALSIRMDESVAEVREVVPQGTLGGLFHHLRLDEQERVRPSWSSLKERLVQKINLEGFPRLEVQVGVEDRFGSDGLREVRVEVARPGPKDAKEFVFRSATEKEPYIVNLLGQKPDFANLYQYRMELAFNPQSPFGPQPNLQSTWQTSATNELVVEPRELYWIREVKVVAAPTFSFSQFPNITVELRFAQQTDRVTLGTAQTQGNWRYRCLGDAPQPFEYRITYHHVSGATSDVVTAWQKQVDEWLSVPDPLPTKRTVNFFFSLPWQDIVMGFIQVRYQDDRNNLRYDEQLDLNQSTPFLRRDYAVAKDGPKTIAYRLTLLLQNGGLLEGSWHETEEDRVVIDRSLVDNRAVRVQSVGGDLVSNRLSEVHVQLEARDPQSQRAAAQTELVFKPGAEASQSWSYLKGDPPRQLFYSGFFVDQNGFVTRLPWLPTSSDLLVVELKQKAIRA
jgi:hypothetical protein